MNKQEIIDKISEDYNITKVEAKQIFEQIFEDIVEALMSFNSGNKFLIPGFGTFELKVRKERQGRNPATGETIAIPKKNVIKFKEAKFLKEKIN